MEASVPNPEARASNTNMIAPTPAKSIVDLHDRITDAYYGKMGQEFMRKTQERIHWVCASAQGSRILDVGCSQGIVPILLGREGKTVVGVDSDSQAVEQAKAHLATEPAHAQTLVRFVEGNFLKEKFRGERFDTVVMSEVLEHVINPQDFVTAAAALLIDGGRLVVTVPFGINDFIDHKRTYYLCDIYVLLASRFDIGEVQLFGQWIGLVGTKQAQLNRNVSTVTFTRDLLEKTEAGFYQIERALREQWAEAKQKLDDASKKYRTVTEQITALQQKLSETEHSRQQAGMEAEQLKTQLADFSADAQRQAATAHAAEKELTSAQAVVDNLRAQLQSADQKYQAAMGQISALQQKAAHEETGRQALASQLSQLQQRFDAAATHLQDEKAKFEQELARLRDRFRAQVDEKLATTQELIHVQAVAKDLRSQFQSADQKYQATMEQILTLKQTAVREEAERQTLDRQLVQLQQQLDSATAHLQTEKAQSEQQLARLRDQLQAQAGEKLITEQGLIHAQAVAADLRSQLKNADQKYQAATEQIAALKQTATREEAQRQGLDKQLAQLQQQFDGISAQSQAEKTKSEQELARLRDQLQAQTDEKHAAEKNLIRVQAEMESLRSQTQSATQKYQSTVKQIALLNQKHQAATDQITVLRQKAAGEKAERQTLTGQLAQLQQQFDRAAKQWQAEKTKSEQELTNLRDRFQTQASEKHAVELQSARAETALGEVRDQINAATAQAAQFHSELQQSAASLEQERAAAANLRAQLDAASQKHQTAVAQLAAEQARFEKAEHALREETATASAKAQSLDVKLQDASRKYRAATEQCDTLKAQAQSAAALLAQTQAEHAQELERIKQRSQQEAKQALAKLQRELDRAQQARTAAAAQVAKTRATLSFQLGYLLLHGFKSWNKFHHLPGQLLALRQEAKRRKQKTRNEFVPPLPVQLPVVAKPLAVEAVRLAVPVPASTQSLKSLRVACIMDEFTFASYQPECNLFQLSVANWQAELEEFKPELLFIESAWRGKDEQWGSKVGHTSAEVLGILQWCRAHQVPTAFWNKEDPIHFETFLTTAKQFDHVFTTDIDCIHRYKAALGHERIYLLPFACQPALSNPIEKYARKDAFCFAGAYYVRYPERAHDLGNFMNVLAQYRPVEIYDRNFGKDDPHYQFPPEYQPFIVGNLPFDQIDKAYKGYRYAINLNSIKQSQTMFARRVYELLASNTITVSNFSRGVRLLFGDLVITSDDGGELVRRIQTLAGDDTRARKFRLAGLRKIMAEHTYQDRFAYLVSKVQGHEVQAELPAVLVTAYARNQEQFNVLLAAFQRQNYARSRLLVVVPGGFEPQGVPAGDNRVQVLQADTSDDLTLAAISTAGEFIAGIVPEDFYGPNYLLDLALATRYSPADVIGKAVHYDWSAQDGLRLVPGGGQPYTLVQAVLARCAIMRRETVAGLMLREWVTSLYTRQLQASELQGVEVLAIDEFNYCKNGAGVDAQQLMNAVCDLPSLDTGLDARELLTRAEHIAPAKTQDDQAPVLTGRALAAYFKPAANKPYTFTVEDEAWQVTSSLPDGKHDYIYAAADLSPADLGFTAGEVKFHLDVTPGLNLQLVTQFLDAQKQRISHAMFSANRNLTAPIPAGTEFIRLGLRIYAGGSATIRNLVLGHRSLQPAEVLGRAEYLILTNHYPSYHDLYRNVFVHSRVTAYAQRGVRMDVFRLRKKEALSYHEFHNVDVITGSQEALHKLLAGGRYKTVAVHFLDQAMWQVLRHYVNKVQIIVWVHGVEIQPWYRRDYNYEDEAQRDAAKAQSEERMQFWRELLRDMPPRLKLIFISRYLAEIVMEDLGFRLPNDKYHIVHNPIDTDLFAYQPKPAEQRKKILSIRPYASRTYANDLSVQVILSLAQKPYFTELEFRLIGDGKLFDEILAPLRGLPNVHIEKRFLTQREIAKLHHDYGVFLCPTRMDTQGVSRDEAMASGLVPITNAVAAIPEFMDASCGFCVSAENTDGLAAAIAHLYDDPAEFKRLSKAASERVRCQSSANVIIPLELQLLVGASSIAQGKEITGENSRELRVDLLGVKN